MTNTTNICTEKSALRAALNNVLTDDWTDLNEVVVLLRYQQLMANVLHPDDSCDWSAEGTGPEMKHLESVLHEQEPLRRWNAKPGCLWHRCARRGTLLAVNRAHGDWGSDLAILDSWAGAAEDNDD